MVPFSMTLNDHLTQISRSHQYSTLNMSLTVGLQDRHILRPTVDNYLLVCVILNDIERP